MLSDFKWTWTWLFITTVLISIAADARVWNEFFTGPVGSYIAWPAFFSAFASFGVMLVMGVHEETGHYCR